MALFRTNRCHTPARGRERGALLKSTLPRATRLRQRLDTAHAVGFFEGRTREDRARHRWIDERHQRKLPAVLLFQKTRYWGVQWLASYTGFALSKSAIARVALMAAEHGGALRFAFTENLFAERLTEAGARHIAQQLAAWVAASEVRR